MASPVPAAVDHGVAYGISLLFLASSGLDDEVGSWRSVVSFVSSLDAMALTSNYRFKENN